MNTNMFFYMTDVFDCLHILKVIYYSFNDILVRHGVNHRLDEHQYGFNMTDVLDCLHILKVIYYSFNDILVRHGVNHTPDGHQYIFHDKEKAQKHQFTFGMEKSSIINRYTYL